MKPYLILILLLSSFFASVQAKNIQIELLPAVNLFAAPIADPKWPKFSMGLAKDFKGRLGKQLWDFSFGENIALAKLNTDKKCYEFGVQAAIFGLMDIYSKPTRLINADYFIGLGISHNTDDIQHLWQLSHVSSHLGDEFLLDNKNVHFKRINLSYETIKWFMRYKNVNMHRIISPYISLGYILHVDPSDIKHLNVGAGLDYFSSRVIFDSSTRFVAGIHVNSWQENKFKPSINIRTGLQYERTKYCDRFIQLLLVLKQGKSQQGQFYATNIRSIGILLAFS